MLQILVIKIILMSYDIEKVHKEKWFKYVYNTSTNKYVIFNFLIEFSEIYFEA